MKKAGVIGFGRFGKLLVERMLAPTMNVVFFEPHELHPGTRLPHNVRRVDTLTEVCDVDWLFYAVPMRCLADVVSETFHRVKPHTVVFDVCSLKVEPCRVMKQGLMLTDEIVGLHPLFGPQSAKEDFKGQKIAVCNLSAKLETMLAVDEWLTSLGITQILCFPEEHDKQMALSQAVTHFIGRVAKNMGVKRLDLSTKSFEDMMDIVDLVNGSSEELFLDMQNMNPYAKETRRRFLDEANLLDIILRNAQ